MYDSPWLNWQLHLLFVYVLLWDRFPAEGYLKINGSARMVLTGRQNAL